MAFHFNLTLHDIWTMSWRRFVVLFDALFPRKLQEDATDNSGVGPNDNGVKKFDVIKDWNELVGSQATAGKPKELHQYMKEQGIGQ